jgi:hypothetical protein
MPAVDPARPPARTVVVLGMLSMFGPLSLDLYLPALRVWSAWRSASWWLVRYRIGLVGGGR